MAMSSATAGGTCRLPASTTATWMPASSLSRAATAQPAEPAPTTT
jgi:hypothetical protein